MFDSSISFWKSNGITGQLLENTRNNQDKLIVLLHGYQGDSESNLEFGKKLLQADQNALVVVLDGLEPVPDRNDNHVRQWWNLPEFDGKYYASMPMYAPRQMQPALNQIVCDANQAAERLNMAILTLMRDKQLRKVVLVGISQGGITAFEMAFFRPELTGFLQAVIAIGAGIAGANRLREIKVKPCPVLLIRGKYDEIFPPSVDYFSKSVLNEVGVPVTLKVEESAHFGLEHVGANDVQTFISKLNRNIL